MTVERIYPLKKFIKSIGAAKDVRNFARHLKYNHPTNGFQDLKLYDFQNGLLKRLQNKNFNIVRYGRQSGVSTLLAVYALWYAIHNPGREVYIFSGNTESSQHIMNMIKGFYEQLRLEKPGVTEYYKDHIVFETNSRIVSTTYQRNHVDLCGVTMDLMVCDLFGCISDSDVKEFVDNSFYRLSKDGRAVLTTPPTPKNTLTKDLYDGIEFYGKKFHKFNIFGSQIPNRSTKSEDDSIEQMGCEKFKKEFNY